MDSDKKVDMNDTLKLRDYIPLLNPAQDSDYKKIWLFIMCLFGFVYCMQQLQFKLLTYKREQYNDNVPFAYIESKPFKPLHDHPKMIPRSSKHEFHHILLSSMGKTEYTTSTLIVSWIKKGSKWQFGSCIVYTVCLSLVTKIAVWDSKGIKWPLQPCIRPWWCGCC